MQANRQSAVCTFLVALCAVLSVPLGAGNAFAERALNGGELSPSEHGGEVYTPQLEPEVAPEQPQTVETTPTSTSTEEAKPSKKSSAQKKKKSKAKKSKKKSKKKKSSKKEEPYNGPFFPVPGEHNFGSEGAQFGADRGTHSHQGQDILAAEGERIVAPADGVVTWRAFQAKGAGYYLVVEAAAGSNTYVFMHLREGSLLVNEGDSVKAGQQIAEVGNTGRSEAPHLHFEIWRGGWYQPGGEPIDPLPLLKKWDKYS